MGVLRFRTAPHAAPDWDGLKHAYMTGYDGRVFPTEIATQPSDEPAGGLLLCQRPLSDSGKLRVPWPVPGRGVQVLSTSSLREREQPYALAVELARGLLGDLRNQAATWRQQGMVLPAAYEDSMSRAFEAFRKAACRQDEEAEAATLADDALVAGCEASDQLMHAYTLQKMAPHRQRTGVLPVVLGCGVQKVPSEDATEAFDRAFTAAMIPINWPTIEPETNSYNWDAVDALVDWGESRRLRLAAGPLLDFSPGGLPEWLRQWSVDQPSLQSFLCDFIEVAKARYRGRITFWTLATGACTGGDFDLSEEQRLTIVARLLEAARRSDDGSQVFLQVESPWGEYQAAGQHRLAPIQFVDALARSNLGLDGLSLQFDLSDPSQLTRHRLLVDIARLIDHWSLLGLPIHITLTIPSDLAGLSPQDWIDQFLPTLMVKPQVTAVFWSQFQDTPESSTGVLDASGTPKPSHLLFASHHASLQAPR